MKKIYFQGVSLISKLALMLVLALAGFASANAAGLSGEIELGKEYPFSSYSTVDVYFTAPADGTVNQYGVNVVYSDADHADEHELPLEYGGYSSKGQQFWYYKVEAGKKYYIYDSFTMNTGTLKVEMQGSADLEVLYRSSDEGALFDLNNYDNIIYRFNEPVEFASVKIECAGQTLKPAHYNVEGEVTVFVTDLKPLIENGTIPAGSVASIVFEGLKGVNSGKYYNDQETTTFTFICPALGVKTVSEVWPAQFKSYWPKGDADGMIKLTYNKELSQEPGAYCELLYGNLEGTVGEDLYVERITDPVVEGKTITFDLTGKRRAPEDMIPAGTNYGTMIIKVGGIKDIDGYAVSSEGQGTIGSYTRDISYVEIPRQIITFETVPANGSSLKGVTDFEFYLSDVTGISFDGFKIEYTNADNEEKEAIVPISAVTSTPDQDGCTYTFAIPAEAQNQKNYKIAPYNIVANDGYDHNEIAVEFDKFVLTYVSPANGTKMKGLEVDQVIEVTTNYSAQYPEMYMMYEIEDMNPVNPEEAIVKSEAWLIRQEDGSYTAEIPQYVKMVQGHTYRCTFTAWATEMDKNYKQDPIGTAYVEWIGATEPYKFSDIKFESISPNEKATLDAADRTFVLTFDGLVNLPAESNFINLGSGASMPFESLEPTGEYADVDAGYSPEWTAVISESFMNNLDASLYLSFKAYDQDNLLVEGNTGTEEQSYFSFVYEVAAAYADYEVWPDAQQEQESLYQFRVFNELGIMPSYNVPFSDAYVMDRGREIVAHVASIDPTKEGEFDMVTECVLTLDTEITEGGVYTLVIPKGMFVIGEETTSWNSAEKTVTYTVAESFKLASDPAEGAVKSLSVIKLTSTIGLLPTEMTEGMTFGKEGEEAAVIADVEFATTEENPWATEITVTLPEEITEEGTYVLTIPEQYFYLQGTYAYSPEVKLTYEVSAETPETPDVTADWTITPAQGAVESLSQIDIIFNNYTEAGGGFGKATLSINGGDAFYLGDAQFGMELNEMVQPLDNTYTEAGTYVISFPEGYFALGADGDSSPAFTLTYVISGSDGINGIAADQNGAYVVYNIAGVKVMETTNAADIKQLASGLYIVNGVKVYVK